MSDADYVTPQMVKEHGPMTEAELKATLWAKINNSIAYQGGKLAQARMQAMRYYNGDKFGNEVNGRSQVVSRDVAEAVDSILPSLLRIFCSTDDAVRFDARRPEDEDIAPQITDYCNWVWNTQNEGFHNFYVWFKAALLDRLGVVKIWWDEAETKTKETYEGLTDDQLSKLVMASDIDVRVIKSYPDPDANDTSAALDLLSEVAKDDLKAQGEKINPLFDKIISALDADSKPAMLHDVEATFTNKTGRIRIVPVPSDEFLIERRAISLDETPFVAHRFKMPISDLIEMFPDKEQEIWDLPTGEEAEYTMERLERFKQEDQLPWRQDNPADPSMREVWVTEAYLRVDYNGDGYGELRKVTVAGDLGYTILDNVEVDDHPFASLCPVPMPFKLFGLSIADQTSDIQLIKSTLLRGILDNMYNAISPQLGVVEGQANYDDLMTRRPGGLVRLKSPNALVPIESPGVGPEPYQMIEYFDTVREQRTGVTRYNQGLDAESLNKTASGIRMIKNAGAERVETIARVFAETGVKRAFKRILELTCKHNRKKQTIRLRGKFVDIDPREWSTQYDVAINVGLGTGDRGEQLQGMMQLLQVDQSIIQLQGGLNGPLLKAENVYNKLAKILEYMGYKSTDPFYSNPDQGGQPQSQQPHQDPHMMAAQATAQADMQREAMKIQAENQRQDKELAHKERLAMADLALKRELGIAQLNLNMQKVGIEKDAVESDRHMQAAKHYADAVGQDEDRRIRSAEIAAAHERDMSRMPQQSRPDIPGPGM